MAYVRVSTASGQEQILKKTQARTIITSQLGTNKHHIYQTFPPDIFATFTESMICFSRLSSSFWRSIVDSSFAFWSSIPEIACKPVPAMHSPTPVIASMMRCKWRPAGFLQGMASAIVMCYCLTTWSRDCVLINMGGKMSLKAFQIGPLVSRNFRKKHLIPAIHQSAGR